MFLHFNRVTRSASISQLCTSNSRCQKLTAVIAIHCCCCCCCCELCECLLLMPDRTDRRAHAQLQAETSRGPSVHQSALDRPSVRPSVSHSIIQSASQPASQSVIHLCLPLYPPLPCCGCHVLCRLSTLLLLLLLLCAKALNLYGAVSCQSHLQTVTHAATGDGDRDRDGAGSQMESQAEGGAPSLPLWLWLRQTK